MEGETRNAEVNALRRRQMRNMLATLILSAGIPMLLAGDELARTQGGNNNAYCQDNRVSWLSWDTEPWQQAMADFTALLTRLRREHRVFQRASFLRGHEVDLLNAPDIAWLRPDASPFTAQDWDDASSRAIGMYLAGAVTTLDRHDLVDHGFYWFLNGSESPVDVVLPGGDFGLEYQLRFDTAAERDWDIGQTNTAGSTRVLAPRSTALWMVTRRDI
jgi:glycogen operon protein